MTSAPPEFVLDEKVLSPQIRRMVRAIGLPATITLLQARGGTRLSMPNGRLRHRKCRVLPGLVGPDAAKAFYAEFGRDQVKDITLPKADKILMQLRNAALKADSRQGLSTRNLALRYKLTTRQVQNILATEDWPTWRKPQLDLFATPADPV